jgi:hypothetical protein
MKFPQVKYKSKSKIYSVVFVYLPTITKVYKGDLELITAALSRGVLTHGIVSSYYDNDICNSVKLPVEWTLFGNNPKNYQLRKIKNWQFNLYSGIKPRNRNQNYWALIKGNEVIQLWRKLPKKHLDFISKGLQRAKSQKFKWIHNTTLTKAEKEQKPITEHIVTEEVTLTENDIQLLVDAVKTKQMTLNLLPGTILKIHQYNNVLKKLT